MVGPIREALSESINLPHVVETGKRLGHDAAVGMFYYGGMALGYSPYPIRNHLFGIGERTYVEMDDLSKERLQAVADRRKPVIVASNHRSVDLSEVEAHPREAFLYRHGLTTVDSFIERSIFEKYGMNLRTLAQYNREWEHHPTSLRRAKARAGNHFREGLYAGLGYIPVHTTFKPAEVDGKTEYVPHATYPYRVSNMVRRCINNGDSVNFFTFHALTDDSFPDKIRPGAVLHAAWLKVPVLPVYIKNARHADPERTLRPDHVVFVVGEMMRFDDLNLRPSTFRREVEAASQDLHQVIGNLRRQAFAMQPTT